MAQTVVDQIQITKTSGLYGGKPTINGKRIGVDLIVELYVNQATPVEEIVERYYPVLSFAEVHAALAYYYDHQEEIDAILTEIKAVEAAYEATVDPAEEAEREARAREIGRQLLGEARRDPKWREKEFTSGAIAALFEIDPATVRRAAISGSIPARKSGAIWLIKIGDAEQRWGALARDPQRQRKPGRPRKR